MPSVCFHILHPYMYECTYICIQHAYLYKYTCICVYILYIHVCTYVSTRFYLTLDTCKHVYTNIHICINIYIHTCLHIYINFVHTCTNNNNAIHLDYWGQQDLRSTTLPTCLPCQSLVALVTNSHQQSLISNHKNDNNNIKQCASSEEDLYPAL